MKEWLILAFIFFIGSLAGWLLELIFRRFFSKANPSRKWINPGFLVGPYLPLYGFSLCVVYLLAHINVSFIHGVYLRKTVLFLLMALSVTLIEYFAGAEAHDAMNTFNESYDNEAVTKAFEKFKEWVDKGYFPCLLYTSDAADE